MASENLQGHFCGFLLVLATYADNGQDVVLRVE